MQERFELFLFRLGLKRTQIGSEKFADFHAYPEEWMDETYRKSLVLDLDTTKRESILADCTYKPRISLIAPIRGSIKSHKEPLFPRTTRNIDQHRKFLDIPPLKRYGSDKHNRCTLLLTESAASSGAVLNREICAVGHVRSGFFCVVLGVKVTGDLRKLALGRWHPEVGRASIRDDLAVPTSRW
jgi:hypothetical protein